MPPVAGAAALAFCRVSAHSGTAPAPGPGHQQDVFNIFLGALFGGTVLAELRTFLEDPSHIWCGWGGGGMLACTKPSCGTEGPGCLPARREGCCSLCMS